VLELLFVNPGVVNDAESTKESDMSRWSAETNAAEFGPLLDDDAERNARRIFVTRPW
jgi:predicted PhzF superfamily epimerase YddE/YHI9